MFVGITWVLTMIFSQRSKAGVDAAGWPEIKQFSCKSDSYTPIGDSGRVRRWGGTREKPSGLDLPGQQAAERSPAFCTCCAALTRFAEMSSS